MDLYKIYEPTNLNDILGNEENKEVIFSYLKRDKIPQCYLFHGEWGCGKTLTAHLLAKELNCSVINYYNASDKRDIDSMREIIQDANFPTFDGLGKAFILDECHQLPTLSQEALLTTLQKTPKNVYFFFCTTEKQKMISTIQSRCQKLKFDPVNSRDLYPYLIEVSKKENNEITKKVARQISETSEGHVRDALTILQKVLVFDNEEKQLKVATEKIEHDNQIIDLCRILLKADSFNDVKDILKGLQKTNPESIRKIVINYMMAVLLGNGYNNKRASIVIDYLEKPVYDYPVLVKNIYAVFI